MGERAPMIDLMAWNADPTRVSYRMHAEYLQRFYLDNELAAGRFVVDGRPAALQSIRVPMFVVGAERDHVALWRSVYKIHHLTNTDMTFVLASGGHNAGIVSEPGHPKRHFRIAERHCAGACLGPENWTEAAAIYRGSWWTVWQDWPTDHSAPTKVASPTMSTMDDSATHVDAPGTWSSLLARSPASRAFGDVL